MKIGYESFLDNKYSKWYVGLIESRKFQLKKKFKTEKHHIFPVSIYGKNGFTVNLTHKEHFIAHLLLTKMFVDVDKNRMSKAFLSISQMQNNCNGRNYIVNSRWFDVVREDVRRFNSVEMKKRWQDPAFRDNITKRNQEYWSKEENRKKQSDKRKEYFSDSYNLDKQTLINREITLRPEWREQRSVKQKELSSNPEYTKKRIDAMSTPESIQKSVNTKKERYTKEQRSEIARVGANTLHENNPNWGEEHANKIRGRKKMTKDGVNKMIKPCDFENFITKGWTFIKNPA